MIKDNNEAIKLNKIDGIMNMEIILSFNVKYWIYVDQYRNLREAFLKYPLS